MKNEIASFFLMGCYLLRSQKTTIFVAWKGAEAFHIIEKDMNSVCMQEGVQR